MGRPVVVEGAVEVCFENCAVVKGVGIVEGIEAGWRLNDEAGFMNMSQLDALPRNVLSTTGSCRQVLWRSVACGWRILGTNRGSGSDLS
jgi:hypothetical protein